MEEWCVGNLPTTKGFGFHVSQAFTVNNSVDLQTPAGQTARLISLSVRAVVTEQYILIVPHNSLMFLSDLPPTPLQLDNLSAVVSAMQIGALGVYGHQASGFYKGDVFFGSCPQPFSFLSFLLQYGFAGQIFALTSISHHISR
jgi:hypothetical protein